MDEEKLYAFGLYCDGHFVYKASAFATVKKTEEEAIQAAEKYWKDMFPENHGWSHHQLSMLEVPKETIIALANQYKDEA
jgi:hypothetical protein